LSTDERESGILVIVHSAKSVRALVWVAPPGLSNSVRRDKIYVLKLHAQGSNAHNFRIKGPPTLSEFVTISGAMYAWARISP
jgi:hypothetical protein